jgi:hypothetical protein
VSHFTRIKQNRIMAFLSKSGYINLPHPKSSSPKKRQQAVFCSVSQPTDYNHNQLLRRKKAAGSAIARKENVTSREGKQGNQSLLVLLPLEKPIDQAKFFTSRLK